MEHNRSQLKGDVLFLSLSTQIEHINSLVDLLTYFQILPPNIYSDGTQSPLVSWTGLSAIELSFIKFKPNFTQSFSAVDGTLQVGHAVVCSEETHERQTDDENILPDTELLHAYLFGGH